jgi:hypothetical protein
MNWFKDSDPMNRFKDSDPMNPTPERAITTLERLTAALADHYRLERDIGRVVWQCCTARKTSSMIATPRSRRCIQTRAQDLPASDS